MYWIYIKHGNTNIINRIQQLYKRFCSSQVSICSMKCWTQIGQEKSFKQDVTSTLQKLRRRYGDNAEPSRVWKSMGPRIVITSNTCPPSNSVIFCYSHSSTFLSCQMMQLTLQLTLINGGFRLTRGVRNFKHDLSKCFVVVDLLTMAVIPFTSIGLIINNC